MRDEIAEVTRHRPHIVTHQYPPHERRESQHLRVLHAIRNDTERKLEAESRFNMKDTCYDALIDIGVGQKLETQPLP